MVLPRSAIAATMLRWPSCVWIRPWSSATSAGVCAAAVPKALRRRSATKDASWRGLRSDKMRLRLVNPATAEHRTFGLHAEKRRWIDLQQILVPDDEVGEPSRLESPLEALLEGGVGAVHRGAANRLLDCNALIWAPGVSVRVGTRHLGAQPEHRLRRARRVIRSGSRLDARIEKIAHGEHAPQALLAVEMHLLAVEKHVARKRQRDDTCGLDTPYEIRGDERAVLDPQPRIAPRRLALQLLVDTQDGVDRNVSVRMRTHLPAGEIGLACLGIERLARGTADAAVVTEPRIGLGEQCRALRDRAVREQLHRPDPYPFIAKARVHAGRDHPVELTEIDVHVEAAGQLACIARILIGLQRLGAPIRLTGRRDAAAGETLRDECGTLAVVLA